MGDTWVCALVCFWEDECEVQAADLRRVVVARTVRSLKSVTCPEAMLEGDFKLLLS